MGREAGAGKPLLKTIFQVRLQCAPASTAHDMCTAQSFIGQVGSSSSNVSLMGLSECR